MPATNGVTRRVEWATAAQPAPGEDASGDAAIVVPLQTGVLLAVADGLGHGPEACEAGALAMATLRSACEEPLPELFRRCHETLRRTRGVVMTLATVDDEGRMQWLGVGNVEGAVFRVGTEPRREGILLRGGVVGYGSLPTLRPETLSLQCNDLLVMATDGIKDDFLVDLEVVGAPSTIASHVLAEHRREYDDALVLVTRYVGDA